jgi:hypothetical protein
MTISFTHEEAQQLFLNALCNGLGHISYYGLELVYKDADYKKARKKLDSPCWEDVLLQILIDGNSLVLVDNECDGQKFKITIQDVYERLPATPIRHLMDMVNEQDDAETADVILQTIFLGEVIYG